MQEHFPPAAVAFVIADRSMCLSLPISAKIRFLSKSMKDYDHPNTSRNIFKSNACNNGKLYQTILTPQPHACNGLEEESGSELGNEQKYSNK